MRSSSSSRAILRVGSRPGTSVGLRCFEQERTDALFRARDDDRPIGGVAVEHRGLEPVHDPVGALAPRAGANPIDDVAVTELLDRDRAAQLAARELCQQLGLTEMLRRDGREDRRGEVGAGEREATHLLEHDDHVDEAETRGHLRTPERAGPAIRARSSPTRPSSVKPRSSSTIVRTYGMPRSERNARTLSRSAS